MQQLSVCGSLSSRKLVPFTCSGGSAYRLCSCETCHPGFPAGTFSADRMCGVRRQAVVRKLKRTPWVGVNHEIQIPRPLGTEVVNKPSGTASSLERTHDHAPEREVCLYH